MQAVTFWTVATVMVVLAIVAVLAPIFWIRSGDEAAAPRRRYTAAAAIAGATPLCALGLYFWLGRPELATGGPGDVRAATAQAHASGAAAQTGAPAPQAAAGDLAAAVARLEARLARGPDDPAGWELLAQSYEYAGRAADAAAARARRLPAGAGIGAANAPSTGASGTPPASAASATAPLPPATSDPALDAGQLAAIAASLPSSTDSLVAEAQRARRARDFPRSLAAFARLEQRQALDASLWADYADATAAQRGRLDAVSETMIRRALALEPRHLKGLWLLGSLQVQRGDYSAALQTWLTMQQVLPKDSPDARLIGENVDEARAMLARAATPRAAPAAKADMLAALEAPAPAAGRSATTSAGAAIQGIVDLDPRWAGKVAPETVLFVLARAEGQPGPPVAVLRTTASRWPLSFVLDDTLAMLPGRNLSSAARVVVEARLSRSGSAEPRPGDLRGRSAPLDPRQAGRLRIVIAEEVS